MDKKKSESRYIRAGTRESQFVWNHHQNYWISSLVLLPVWWCLILSKSNGWCIFNYVWLVAMYCDLWTSSINLSLSLMIIMRSNPLEASQTCLDPRTKVLSIHTKALSSQIGLNKYFKDWLVARFSVIFGNTWQQIWRWRLLPFSGAVL